MYLSVGPHAVRGGDLAFTLSAAKMRAGTGKIHHASVRVFSFEGVSRMACPCFHETNELF